VAGRVARVPVLGTRVLGWNFRLEALHNLWVTTTFFASIVRFGKTRIRIPKANRLRFNTSGNLFECSVTIE
jgi:hypothetical protein